MLAALRNTTRLSDLLIILRIQLHGILIKNPKQPPNFTRYSLDLLRQLPGHQHCGGWLDLFTCRR